MALILVHCYQRSCWMAACLGTTLFNKYFLQGRSSLGICRINQELSLLKTLIAVPLIRNVESGDDIVILDQTGCGLCAMRGVNRQCQFLAHASLVCVQQVQLLVYLFKLKRAQGNACRTNPFVAPRRRLLSNQRVLRRISNLCHCVAQQLFWNRKS